MGTEESIFSILVYRHPDIVEYFDIDQNGLLGTFFENVKNGFAVATSEKGPEDQKSLKEANRKIKSLSNLQYFFLHS